MRPDHLFLGTHLTNAQDRERKRRGVSLFPQKDNRGEANGFSKLNAEKVRQIRADDLARVSRKHRLKLAASLGVTATCIYDVAIRRRWRHVE